MADDSEEKINVSAPWSWLNWEQFNQGRRSVQAAEYLIYTDAWVNRTEISTGPIHLTLGTAFPDQGHIAPAVTLRIDDHLPEFDVQPMEKTDTAGWLNLTIDDELACLMSLITGSRMRAGGMSREFKEGEDPRGTAHYYLHRAPDWTPLAIRNPIYPGANSAATEEMEAWLNRYPALTREDSVALVRAARQFRDALWVAESDPELSWLFLVSALEGPAGRSAITAEEDPVKIFATEMPSLAEELQSKGGDDLLASVAQQLLPIVKATNRFLNFVTEYAPNPPTGRPPEYAQVPWEKLRKKVAQVYSYRSKRLHEGVPFPNPMCDRPLESIPVPDEVPTMRAAAKGNAAWVAKDIPMHLHMFGYIARGCLLNWWAEISRE
ncbi:hypothetical protein [Streptomyces parvulus]|uniref:hypothetical protein n=1 Tax=Streptomyces parvulus TaxID=146923 RepID=UPI00210D7025|nr:hypothetical protein [Streptomyces parvulus]MCQ4196311.1 hypothetical protein [Streptomyces parvulus]